MSEETKNKIKNFIENYDTNRCDKLSQDILEEIDNARLNIAKLLFANFHEHSNEGKCICEDWSNSSVEEYSRTLNEICEMIIDINLIK